MAFPVTRIKFKGTSYILIGETSGAITSEYLFRCGELGFAYLTATGNIMRNLRCLGTIGDIDFGETEMWPDYLAPASHN
jgi:hypothetical protein